MPRIKRVTAIIVVIAVVVLLSALLIRACATDGEIKDSGYQLIDTDDQTQIAQLIDECLDRQDKAHTLAEAARSLGCAEDHAVIQWASKEWWMAEYCRREYASWRTETAEESTKEEIEETDTGYRFTTQAQWDQYPVAAQMYEYFRGEMGLSPAVSAGLIGGYMEESGGQTMDINPYIYAGSGKYSYYGFAMYSLYYCPEVAGMTLEQQLDYLAKTLQKNIEFFSGSYDYFISLTDPGAVVDYYYRYYGRGYGNPSRQRIKNGYTAMEYFGGV